MTSANSHPRLDILADLAGDVRDDGEIRTARTHLTSCSTCMATYEALSSLPARLAASPPPPMPLDVVARIDAALVRAAQERASPARVAQAVRPSDRGYRRATVARWVLGVAATAAASVAVGLVVANGVQFGGSSDDSADGASVSAEGGPDVGESPTSQDNAATTGPDATSGGVGVDLDRVVLALVARTEARQSTATKTTGTQVDPSSEGVDFENCVATVNASTGRGLTPIAADTTIYGGDDAVLLVFPRNDPSTVEAYVLTTACLESTDQVDFDAAVVAQATVHR